ncbi:15232_t:CDS:1, partial [Cetraspora pellucida]
LVDLSDPIFEENNNKKKAQETVLTNEEPSIEFESKLLVWDILSDNNLYK